MDRFLASHESRAYRMALLATGRREDALDIVQDAMMKLVKRYAGKHQDEWPGLFIRIVQNAIRDWYRRENIRQRWRHWFGGDSEREDMDDPIEQIQQTGVHMPDEQLNQTAAMQKLDSALKSLPVRQQQVFLLRQWEGLDVAQTASAMGISEGSVKTHYSRAVHKLREELEDYWQ
jgi:RNA polymerase sigma-70 factor (ECF subfamily)